jgi:hypothetical protein
MDVIKRKLFEILKREEPPEKKFQKQFSKYSPPREHPEFNMNDVLRYITYLQKKYPEQCFIGMLFLKYREFYDDPTISILNLKGDEIETDNFLKICNKRFVSIPVVVFPIQGQSHQNIILIDNDLKHFYYFEPHQEIYQQTTFLKNIALNNGYKFIDLSQICPIGLFQTYDAGQYGKSKYGYNGMCVFWAFWFLEYVLQFKEKEKIDVLISKSVLKMNNISLTEIIYKYAAFFDDIVNNVDILSDVVEYSYVKRSTYGLYETVNILSNLMAFESPKTLVSPKTFKTPKTYESFKTPQTFESF